MIDPEDFDTDLMVEQLYEEEMGELMDDLARNAIEEIAEKEEEKLVEFWHQGFDYAHEYMPDLGHEDTFSISPAIIPTDSEEPPSAPRGYRYQQTFVLAELTEDEVQGYYYD